MGWLEVDVLLVDVLFLVMFIQWGRRYLMSKMVCLVIFRWTHHKLHEGAVALVAVLRSADKISV